MLTQTDYTWHQPKRWIDWWPYLWAPGLVFIGFFIWFEPLQISQFKQKTLAIIIQAPAETKPQKNPAIVEPKPQPKPRPEPEPIPQTPPQAAPERQPKKAQVNTHSPPTQIDTTEPAEKHEPKISSGILFNQAKQHTDIRITGEFKAASPMAYKSPAVTSHNPYEDIPYQPIEALRMDLNFYANGYRGDMQRFGDAITLEKTFTTRYGTKIKCALMVIFLGCSWK